ncbi:MULTISPECIES: ChbG/HpnK family deacetylase [Ramlibacter]|uniref:ChbG/HpnK family deacetylase n=1 Tax=Ramlibacter aquaticus TaxID=2780094 RepID=A0ABR9SFC3_9BURK|nr:MULTISPECIES: ChbG/HpnK family deacetylase [Ramlibacter]MBE7941046.1 ChbG/HpnK family deacetylase [Ramlibacter aquaticus]
MATPIAICVDDFGHHAGVDAAVLALARQGRISAASCMVGGPSWAQGAPALRELDPRAVDLGLHLDLTATPLDASLRGGLGAWMLRSSARLAGAGRLRVEIEAQLDRFEAALGRAPAHVDGHQHVHQFPVVRDALMQVLTRRYPRQRPWLRRTRRVPGQPFAGKSAVIDAMGCAGLERLAAAAGFAQNAHLLGVYDLQGDSPTRYAALLRGWFAAAGARDLLMCHPAADVPGAQADPLLATRQAELAVLGSAQGDEMLSAAGLRLARMGDLLQEA